MQVERYHQSNDEVFTRENAMRVIAYDDLNTRSVQGDERKISSYFGSLFSWPIFLVFFLFTRLFETNDIEGLSPLFW